MRRLIVFSCLFSLGLAPDLEAQFSWKPRPLPAARTFLVTEIGYAYRVNDYAENTFNLQRRHYLTSEIGFMANTSESFAIGATNFIGADEGGNFRWGVKLRLRRWLTSNSSIEVAPGLLFADSRGNKKGLAFMGNASLSVTEWFALVGQVEVVPTGFAGGTDHAVYLGARTGSTAGLVLNAVTGTLAAVIGIWYFVVCMVGTGSCD